MPQLTSEEYIRIRKRHFYVISIAIIFIFVSMVVGLVVALIINPSEDHVECRTSSELEPKTTEKTTTTKTTKPLSREGFRWKTQNSELEKHSLRPFPTVVQVKGELPNDSPYKQYVEETLKVVLMKCNSTSCYCLGGKCIPDPNSEVDLKEVALFLVKETPKKPIYEMKLVMLPQDTACICV